MRTPLAGQGSSALPTVADLVGRTLAQLGAGHVFGVVGSGNFDVTNSLRRHGVPFTAARHEGGAAVMADAYARMSDRLGVLTVHQGCGLTNALTGIGEAAKSRTPLLVLAADTAPAAVLSNFAVDQDALSRAVGAVPERVHSAASAVADTVRAFRTAVHERRTVVLNLPLDVQAASAPRNAPATESVASLVELVRAAERPVFVAGRGARGAGPQIAALAAHAGALLATSAVASGLFEGEEFALGAHRPIDLGVLGDTAATARDALAVLRDIRSDPATKLRTPDVAARISAEARWNDVPFQDLSTEDPSTGKRVDPRSLTIELDRILPRERVVPDEFGFCFTQAFQSVGLGLGTAIGASYARPERLPVLGTGDGGLLMAISELETAVRLGIPLVVVVYNDAAYGAEVHHFAPNGPGAENAPDLGTVVFPDTDFAALARGYGASGVTVHRVEDLTAVSTWLEGERSAPLVVDAKVASNGGSWWLMEAFGH